mmetsp:Transcript_27490/g.27890  ORF Transcript_27490/g.27890 Transcript_27490/m.27890 type:complete len:105 (-) Transcript_27490:1530-1844(-)
MNPLVGFFINGVNTSGSNGGVGILFWIKKRVFKLLQVESNGGSDNSSFSFTQDSISSLLGITAKSVSRPAAVNVARLIIFIVILVDSALELQQSRFYKQPELSW